MTTHTENTPHVAATNIFRRARGAVPALRGLGVAARTQPLNRVAWPTLAACAASFALGVASAALMTLGVL